MPTGEVVRERAATFTPGSDKSSGETVPGNSLKDRVEHARKDDAAKKSPRTAFLKDGKGGGGAKEHFDLTGNKEAFEDFTFQSEDRPKTMEEMTDSEREKFLKTGELPPAKETKPGEKAAEKTGAKDDRGGEGGKKEESAGDSAWTKEAHEERVKTFRTDTLKKLGQKDETGKTVLDRIEMPAGLAKSPGLVDWFFRVVADCRNPEGVMRALAEDPAFLKDEGYWTSREGLQQLMSDVGALDRRLGRNGGSGGGRQGARGVNKITGAGKPASEVGGKHSTVGDEAEAALAKGDGDRYREIMNERDREKRRARFRRS